MKNTIEVYKINFSGRDSIECTHIYRAGNTKNLYINCKYSYYTDGRKILERSLMNVEKLQKEIKEGKSALFSISVNTDTFPICNHNKLGIACYMTKPMFYEEFKKDYIEKEINISSSVELEQGKLF